jgi:signal transduction histidine kinase
VETLLDWKDMPREEQENTYAILQKHSQRLNALVEDLLILARLEARSDELNREPINITKFCEETVRDWLVRIQKRQVELKLDLRQPLPVVDLDRMRIEQVLTNLVDNAYKFTAEGGTITIGAEVKNEHLEMWVKDTGQGILSTDLPHIFERFYRVDKARSRDCGGTGLGLSIVKHIARAHGGNVSATSVFGKGTEIRLSLPVKRS